jgi:hypothetical protein
MIDKVILQINTRRNIMPMGKGTYGSKKGRPSKSSKLKGGQKKLPSFLKKKIMNSKRGK